MLHFVHASEPVIGLNLFSLVFIVISPFVTKIDETYLNSIKFCTPETSTSLTLLLQCGRLPRPLRWTFYPVALKQLRIVTKAFVTFCEFVWAKMLKKN